MKTNVRVAILFVYFILSLAIIVEARPTQNVLIYDGTAEEPEASFSLQNLFFDMSDAVEDLGSQEFGTYDMQKFRTLARKWNALADRYSLIDDLEPVVGPLIEDILIELPKLRPPAKGDIPFQNLCELYEQMQKKDLFGSAALFSFIFPQEVFIEKEVKEFAREIVVAGVKTTKIIRKKTIVKRNNAVAYYEIIEDDNVVERYIEDIDKTVMHQTLREMKENNENPAVISAVEDLVGLIDYYLDVVGASHSSGFLSFFKRGQG